MIKSLSFLPYIFLFFALFSVAYQDLTKRRVHILWFVLIFSSGIIINLLEQSLSIKPILQSIAFIGVNVVGVFIYYSIKKKQAYNPLDKMIGIGDIVMFLVITPLFNFKEYMLFFIISLICALVIYFFCQKKLSEPTIPLAGYMALTLMMYMIFRIVKTKFLVF